MSGSRLAGLAAVTSRIRLATLATAVGYRNPAHLATRAECYIFPTGVERAQWVLDLESRIAREKVIGFEVVAREQGWTLLRRKS